MIGVDILEISRMAAIIQRSGDIFLKRVYSESEIILAQKCHDPIAFYASAFAAKEAVFKALNLCWEQGIDIREIEIARGTIGEPIVELFGSTKRIAREKGILHLYLTLSYETNITIAIAYALKGNSLINNSYL